MCDDPFRVAGGGVDTTTYEYQRDRLDFHRDAYHNEHHDHVHVVAAIATAPRDPSQYNGQAEKPVPLC
jgi:hypothetical protein